MKWLLLGCCLAACGRVGFERERSNQVDANAALDSAVDVFASDAAPALAPCATTTAAPAQVLVAGETFYYSGILNMTSPVAGASITLSDPTTGVIGTAVSDATGAYSMTVDTGGMARPIRITYSQGTYWRTTIYTDVWLTGDLVGPNMTRWQLGDGPLWSPGGMGAVYGNAGQTVDTTKGTINLAVRDCAENVIEGVVFDIQPPPGAFMYIDTAGAPTTTLSSTVAPYTSAIAFNAQPGPTHIAASKSGLTFLAMDIVVPAGSAVTYPAFHPQ